MNFKHRLKKEINSIEPNQTVLKNVLNQCGIESTMVQVKPRRTFRLIALPIFACLMLAVICTSIVFALPKGEEAYVLIEMNPKVQLVAQNNIVTKQRALNKEAQILLLGTDYRGKSIASAIELVVRDAEMLGLISKGDSVCISMVDTTQIGGKVRNIQGATAYDSLSKDYQLTTVFSNKSGLVNAVAKKCDKSKVDIENKSVEKLIAMYTDYNESELLSFSKTICTQINSYRAELELNLKSDKNLADYENILDLIQAIKYNLLVYNNGQTDDLRAVLEKYVDIANVRYDNILQNFTFDSNGISTLNALIDDYENRCISIKNSFTSIYEEKIRELKLNILATME